MFLFSPIKLELLLGLPLYVTFKSDTYNFNSPTLTPGIALFNTYLLWAVTHVHMYVSAVLTDTTTVPG